MCVARMSLRRGSTHCTTMHWYTLQAQTQVCPLGHTIYRVTVLRPAALMQRPGCEPESLIATQRALSLLSAGLLQKKKKHVLHECDMNVVKVLCQCYMFVSVIHVLWSVCMYAYAFWAHTRTHAHIPMQTHTPQHTTAHHTTPHCTAPHRTVLQHNTTQHNHNAAQHNHNAAQHSTAQHNPTQHNTVQHSTAQCSTTQYNTTQHNTTPLVCVCTDPCCRMCGFSNWMPASPSYRSAAVPPGWENSGSNL